MNCQVSRDGKVFGELSVAGDVDVCGANEKSMVSWDCCEWHGRELCGEDIW